MEVKETAACGISQREFAVEFDEEDLIAFYRILRFARDEVGFYDEDYLEDLESQLSYIVGPAFEEEPEGSPAEIELGFEESGDGYLLKFNEESAKSLRMFATTSSCVCQRPRRKSSLLCAIRRSIRAA